MAQQSYFGLDSEDEHSWTLAQCINGNTLVLQRFNNTVAGMSSMERFLRGQGRRPRICIKLSNESTLKLLEYLGSIPEIEVILVNEAGFKQYQIWLSKPRQTPTPEHAFRAEMLARCAERMI